MWRDGERSEGTDAQASQCELRVTVAEERLSIAQVDERDKTKGEAHEFYVRVLKAAPLRLSDRVVSVKGGLLFFSGEVLYKF